MENDDNISNEELSQIIEDLIDIGAMEILGYDKPSDQFTYRITSKCKEVYPQLYYAHYQAVGEMAQELWMKDIVDIVFYEGHTVVGVTPEQLEYIRKNIDSFTEDERFFLETLISNY
jgi:DNA repair photolyase